MVIVLILIVIIPNLIEISEDPSETISYISYRVIHTLELQSEPEIDVKINCTIPSDTANFQIVKNVEYSIVPSHVFIDEHNNTIAHFSFSKHEGNITITIVSLIEVNELDFRKTLPLHQYNTSTQIFQQYTKPEIYIESDSPLIRKLAYNITNNSSNPIEASKLICEWVNKNLNHTGYHDKSRGALWTLENGSGDCSEFAHLFVALCRAVEIPSRFVDGISLWSFSEEGIQKWDVLGHDWAEVYFPNIGWVWVDPFSNQFGCSDGKHIALQHGQYSESLGGWYRYHHEGVSNVTEHFEIYFAD